MKYLFFVLFICSQIANAQSVDSLLNKQAPDFQVVTLDSITYSLENMKDKVVILNFWFMACYPCVRELPDLNKVVEKYAGKEVVFLAISVQDKAENLRIFLKRKPFLYKIVAKNKEIVDKFNVNLFPANLVIDKTGKIVFIKVGYDEKISELLSEAIDKALKEE